MDEFGLIQRFFQRPINNSNVSVGIGDDGAIVDAQNGYQQVHVIDTLLEGTHFPNTTSPADIAFRSVAVNVSDIAAMGAAPNYMTLALTMAHASEDWVRDFASGLFACADEFGIDLIGGDTTRGPQTIVTIAMMGQVETGKAILRSGAMPGDSVFVSGTLGDAAAGLQRIQAGIADDGHDYLVQRFLRPSARVDLGRSLLGRASAAIDVSDGLLGDLGKLLDASERGAVLDLEQLPLSEPLRSNFPEPEQRQFALCGGDDYELCFTSPDPDCSRLPGVTRIGVVTTAKGIECRANGDLVRISDAGYRHFE